MAISTYSELKTAITEWMDREDIAGNAADFVTLAEARLNRVLDVVEADANLTGTTGSRRIDISALKVIEGIALYRDDDGESKVVLRADGSFPYLDTIAAPGYAAIDGNYLDFDCLLDAPYTFRFRYRGRFALSDAAPTNDLLTNHPDVYLAACIVWGGVFTKDIGTVQNFKSLLDEFIFETRNHLAQRKRSVLSPSSDLADLCGATTYDNEAY